MPIASALSQPEKQTGATLAALLARVADQDRAAFAQLYQATSLKLYGVAWRILKRKQAAEDVVQDAYVKIWDRAGDFNATRGSAIAWMVTIVRNRALDDVRRGPQLVAADDVEGLDNIADVSMLASDQMQQSEEYQRLVSCLNGIDDDKRKMVLLAYHQGLSREHLAQRFGHPVATIKTWLRRSLESLKLCLES